VNQTLERAWQDNHTVDIAALELNTLKMAFNITFHDLRALSIPFFVQHLDMGKLPVSMKEVSWFTMLKGFIGILICGTLQVFGKWVHMLKRFTHSTEDQKDILQILTVRFSFLSLIFLAKQFNISRHPAFDQIQS
jgi:translation initiation factor eIF-2B subunit epsilon